jgi:hypothetical protein
MKETKGFCNKSRISQRFNLQDDPKKEFIQCQIKTYLTMDKSKVRQYKPWWSPGSGANNLCSKYTKYTEGGKRGQFPEGVGARKNPHVG